MIERQHPCLIGGSVVLVVAGQRLTRRSTTPSRVARAGRLVGGTHWMSRRSTPFILGVAALVAFSCTGTGVAENERTSIMDGASLTLESASDIADMVVRDTIAQFFSAALVVHDGLGAIGCDGGGDQYDTGRVVLRIEHRDGMELLRAIWTYWQDEYQFRLAGPPLDGTSSSVHGKRNDFWGSFMYTREASEFSFGVATPCFDS